MQELQKRILEEATGLALSGAVLAGFYLESAVVTTIQTSQLFGAFAGGGGRAARPQPRMVAPRVGAGSFSFAVT